MRNKYLSADKQLKLFTSSDSESENACSQEENNDINGPILNLNDDIWDEVRDDKEKDSVSSLDACLDSESKNNGSQEKDNNDKNESILNLNDDIGETVLDDNEDNNISSSSSSPDTSSSSSSDTSSDETSERLNSSLSDSDARDPNESKDFKNNKLIQIVKESCEEEIIEELPNLITDDKLCIMNNVIDEQPISVDLPLSGEVIEDIDSDIDTTMFDMVDIMLENSGKTAAEYAQEIEHNSVENVTKSNEETIQEKMATDELTESLGQLTTDISLAMQELQDSQQHLTDVIDMTNSIADESEESESAVWTEEEILAIEENKFEEITNEEQITTERKLEVINEKIQKRTEYVIKAFEKDEMELKALLQKLEDKNEIMYPHEELLMHKNEHMKNDENDEKNIENTKKICGNILEDILENLEIAKNAVKNYKMIDLNEYEKDEKPTQSTEENNKENFKTLNNVLSNFNKMMEEMIRKNREEKQRQEEKLRKIQRKSVGSTAAQKAECLNNLLKSPNLAEFNADTHESLTKKIEIVRVKQEKDLKKLVDRVYAQRDKYNDTLEVIDNRLVVVKQHTGEIEELPEPNYIDDSDDSESDDISKENEFVWEGVPLIEAHRLNTNKQDKSTAFASVFDYKPTNRLAINEVMQNFNEEVLNSESESNEEFFSIPDHTNSIDNIDKDFINNLDFHEVELNEKCCGDQPIVQCARSYDELRSLIGVEKDKTSLLTDEENKLLHDMLEQDKSCNERPQTIEENILLQKLIERTKEIDLSEEISTSSTKETTEQEVFGIEIASGQETESKGGISSTEVSPTDNFGTLLNENEDNERYFNELNGNEILAEYDVKNELLAFFKTEDEKAVKSHEVGCIFLVNGANDMPTEEIEVKSHVNNEIIEEIPVEETTKDDKIEDEHISNIINIYQGNNESASISNDQHFEGKDVDTKEQIRYVQETDEFCSESENKEIGTEFVKEQENVEIDAEGYGDNEHVSNKYIKDDGHAYLVLQSAKLFEYIGDGNHTEKSQLTSSVDCTGAFLSNIDDIDDDDCDAAKADAKENETTTAEISLQCDS